MASNSKKRRRVLAATCILAALIVAGSSFAWFTSKDEVTNRLSANANYGVRITESFAPPAQWLPGMEVNKDVYAVNTGDIPAFVKEVVSGVMTVTTEKAVPANEFDVNDCVKLTQAERYAVESGSYLVFQPQDSAYVLGRQIVDMTPDANDPDAYVAAQTDFKPYADGLYVFRKTIAVDGDTFVEQFTYDGYYYYGQEFYKISNLVPNPDFDPDFADDGVDTDGILRGATAGFYKEVKQKIVPTLTYDVVNNMLVATVDTGVNGASYNDLADAAQVYDEALEGYEHAVAAFSIAVADYENGNAYYAELLNAVDAAAQNLLVKAKAAQAAGNAENAARALVNDLTARQTALQTEIGTLTQAKYDAQDDLNAATQALSDYETNYPTARAQFEADVLAEVGKTLDQCTYNDLCDRDTSVFSNYQYYQLYVAKMQAQDAYDAADDALAAAQAALAEVEADLQTAEDDLIDAQGNAQYADGEYTAAQSALLDAQNNLDQFRQPQYDEIMSDYEVAIATLSSSAQYLEDAKQAYEKALKELNPTGVVKINIKLSDDVVSSSTVGGKWLLLPVPENNATTAAFYYTSILGGGQTTSKLIDSVELDASVTQELYKSFDFDLNVELKSAQVVYDADNTTILTTAANAELGAVATLANATDLGTKVTWTAAP